MTWVVAASTIFGYGALYSDVQVTFESGATKDLLQKAYPVGNSIAAGFAGSVKIGCRLVESLITTLSTRDHEAAWHPVAAALRWAPVARAIFGASEVEERALQSRFLLVGASPTESCGLGARIYFVRFASPEFEPQVMRRATKICSIGSGSGVAEYKHSIKPLLRHTSGILQAEVGRPGGWGNMLGHSISLMLGRNPRSGISRNLHTILVGREGFMYGKTDQVVHHDGQRIEHRMPTVAQSYGDFLALASAAGHEAACAQC